VGHRAPGVVQAIHSQVDRYMHTCFQVLPYDSYVRLAERMNQLAPGKSPKKTFFVNSGAEAVENAVKVARAYTKRPAIIAFEDAFHGRTMMGLALTSKTHPYKAGFEPFPGDVYRVPFAYCYRCSYSLKYPECGVYCAQHLEDTFKRVVAAESVAAVIAEPVLGEGGFVTPPLEFFRIVVEICRKHGILFIADEVQTGFGRTGRMFACEQFGITPDILVTAKSLAGGLPLAAVVGRAELMDSPDVSGLGGTYSGNPVALAAAHAVLDRFAKGDLFARAETIGARIESRMREWERSSPLVGDIRRLGAMVAIELVRDRVTKEPAKEETNDIIRRSAERGLILMPAGTYGNVIRILVPLVVSEAELDEGLDVLGEVVSGVMQNSKFKMQTMP
jgi:4-aminobutyrate aminotransferase/(S)-3-amino-2-methylpropionate transaminase